MTVNILGTEYTFEYKTEREIEEHNARGTKAYADPEKKMLFAVKGDDEETRNQLRQMIITLFAEEAGVENPSVRWMATQFPKILKASKEVGAIEGCGCKCQKQPNGQEIMDAVIAGKTLAEAAKMHDVNVKCDEFLDKFLED